MGRVITAAGFRRGRYRLDRKDLPCKLGLVFPRYRAVIFVHGCFWHGHDCRMFKLPATRTEFWREKIAANQERDRTAIEVLREAGWRVLIVWECFLRGPRTRQQNTVIAVCAEFIRHSDEELSRVEGHEHPTYCYSTGIGS